MYRSPLILRSGLNGIHVTEIYPNGFIFVPMGPQWDKGSFLSRSVNVVKSLILAQSARCVGNRSFVNFDILSLARYRRCRNSKADHFAALDQSLHLSRT